MKVCNLYGAGFFYVPGTDTCLKIGMFLRSDHAYGAGDANFVYAISGADARYTRTDTDYYTFRARINLTTDWRTQTDYGVLRAYAAIIAQSGTGNSATGVAGILRAFIQFAGFTVGHAVSYFDFFNGADYGYMASVWGAGTGVNGTDLIAYTWQLGNGWSISVDLEDGDYGRANNVLNASAASITSAGAMTSNNKLAWSPDVAANIRVDQAWGSAQLSAALHDGSGGYYAGNGAVNPITTTPTTTNGHPGDAWGWAIQGGVRLTNLFQPRNTFEVSAYVCEGATAYCVSTPTNYAYGSGNTIGVGWAADGVFTTGSGIEKTEAWGFQAAYQHYWNAQWRTSVVGGYTEVNYNSTATAMLCGTAPNTAAVGGATNVFGGAITGTGANFVCNPDFSQWAVSSRTAWNPHPTLEIGLDLIWWHLDTAMSGTATLAANGARPAALYTFDDQDRYVGVLRVQKTVLP